MISNSEDSYIQSVVERFLGCSCGAEVGAHENCAQRFRHLALAACREVAMAKNEYITSLETSVKLFDYSKRSLHAANNTASEYHQLSVKLSKALEDIESVIEKARK